MAKKKKVKNKKETWMEALASSATFMAIGNQNYLRGLHNSGSGISRKVALAKKLNKPVILVLTNELSQSDKADFERYFIGHNVIKVIDLILWDEDSMNSAFSEIGKTLDEVRKKTVSKRYDEGKDEG